MISLANPPAPILTDDDRELDYCCHAALQRGVEYCTCWRPIYDVDQAEPDTSIEPTTRAKCCHDCAYRKGSDERERGEGEDLQDMAGGPETFFCHQGMRRIVAYRHPDGRERPAQPHDYEPAQVGDVAFKADGTPAERCAGWATIREGLLR